MEKYYTPEQLEYLEGRRGEVGEARIRQVEAEWAELMKQVRAEMETGMDPSNERVQALAERWMGLVNEFTGENPGIERSVGNIWQQEETIHGLDTGEVREMMAYVFRATASSNEGEARNPSSSEATQGQRTVRGCVVEATLPCTKSVDSGF